MVQGIYKVALERSAYFYMKIKGDLERSQHFNFEASFLKSENRFHKTGVLLFN